MVARNGSGPRHRPATAELLCSFGVDPLRSKPSIWPFRPIRQKLGEQRRRQVDE